MKSKTWYNGRDNTVDFADSSHKKEASQLFYTIRLMMGLVKKGNPFHLLSWASYRSRGLAKSRPAAEILAARESVEEIVIPQRLILKLIGVEVKLMTIVGLKDLNHDLSSKKNTIHKYVRPHVNKMPFYFETTKNVFAWIPGSLNPAVVGQNWIVLQLEYSCSLSLLVFYKLICPVLD